MLQKWVERVVKKQSIQNRKIMNYFLPHVEDWGHVNTVFYQIQRASWLGKLMSWSGVSGITLGYVVLVRHNKWFRMVSKEERLSDFVKHEMVHHMQYERAGGLVRQLLRYVARYIFIYLFLWRKHPYYDNPYEREARAFAEQTSPDWKARRYNRWLPWKF